MDDVSRRAQRHGEYGNDRAAQNGMPRMTGDATARIRRLNPPELGTSPGYSQIVDVRADRIVFIAGQTALNQQGVICVSIGKRGIDSSQRPSPLRPPQ
jgi:enamine deaminase RidA (YjgF/YER057c/UK114 family)